MTISQRTRRGGVLAVAAGLLIALIAGTSPAVAATQTLTVKHTDVTTVEGTLNETYYGGGTWASVSTAHYADTGAFFDVAFQGSAVDLYGSRRNTNGTGSVYIDGALVGTANYYSTTNQTSVKVFSATGLGSGTHVIKVVANGWVNHVSTVVTSDIPTSTTSALASLIARDASLTSADYTSASWSAFADELSAARTLVADSTATQSAVDAEVTKLQAASDQLVEIKGLKSIVTEYQTRVPTSYTRSSWVPFATALTAASDVTQQVDATATQVASTKGALQGAAGGLQTVSSGSYVDIQNDQFWKDTDGNPIYSQGGGIFRFGDTYYWYGVDYHGAATYEANPTALNSDTQFVAVTAYSSQDLQHWKFENNIATPSTKLDIPASKNVVGTYFSDMKTLADATWIGRLGVVYNENTGKYVMLSQMENKDPTRATNAGVLFLEGDSPTDDFQYANLQPQIVNAPQQGTGDQTVFTDDNGEDYLLFSNRSGRGNMYLSKIADSNSLSVGPGTLIGKNGAGREGNAMFKIGDTYYAAASDLHGYNASVAYVIQSLTSNPQGAYSSEYVLPGTEKDYSHVSQTGFFFTVKGTKQDTVVFAGDRWADFAGNGIGYNQWMPLSGTGSGVSFSSVSDWNLNPVTGEWHVGDNNNYVLNPDVAADRVAVTTVTGWTNQVDASSVAQSLTTNPTPGANGSRYALRLGASTAFSGSVYQDDALPDGLYTFSLQDQTAGGLDSAHAVVTGSAGQTYSLDLGAATTGWQSQSMGELKITGGTARISIVASGPGGRSVSVDALSLVKESVDASALKLLVTSAGDLDSANSSSATWTPLATALAAAKSVLADPTSTQAEVDAADSALAAAVDALVPAVRSITVTEATSSYGAGSPFDTASLNISATLADGSTTQLTSADVDVQGYSPTTPGKQVVRVIVHPSLTAVGADPVQASVAVTVYPSWSSSAIYTANDQVWHAGAVWLASWWTQAQTPGDPYGPWQEDRSDAAGHTIWTATRIFMAGDLVVYNGVQYKAAWWTRNETPQPGEAYGPWLTVK